MFKSLILGKVEEEVQELQSMRGTSVFKSDGNTELMCAHVKVPDVYSLRVTKARYTQMNWHDAFQVTYFGPMVMTVEILFDACVSVVVKDLAGNDLDDATVELAMVGTDGQRYQLGTAPRKMVVEIPRSYTVTATRKGYKQVTKMAQFPLSYASWPDDLPIVHDAHGNHSAPLEIVVRMMAYEVEFQVEDSFGTNVGTTPAPRATKAVTIARSPEKSSSSSSSSGAVVEFIEHGAALGRDHGDKAKTDLEKTDVVYRVTNMLGGDSADDAICITLERALLDLLCLRKEEWPGETALLQGLRIDEQAWKSVDVSEMDALRAVYKHRRMQRLIDALQKDLADD